MRAASRATRHAGGSWQAQNHASLNAKKAVKHRDAKDQEASMYKLPPEASIGKRQAQALILMAPALRTVLRRDLDDDGSLWQIDGSVADIADTQRLERRIADLELTQP